MARTLDAMDARLLDLIQVDFPLASRPYAAIGNRLGADEGEVLARLGALKAKPSPAIRQIGAIFDSKSLGYRTTLVAAEIPVDRLEAAAEAINAHPGVSHNYQRSHAFNLWYTLAVPPDSRPGLERTVEILHRESGATSTRVLPTLKLYKIGVRLAIGDADGGSGGDARGYSEQMQQAASAIGITEADKVMIRALQRDLPLTSAPFAELAAEGGVDEEDLLAAARRYLADHRMRRFAAVLRHREVGFSANAMGVWAVAAEKADDFGHIAAGFEAVSHCYLRPAYPDWRFNIFTMVHAGSVEGCHAVLDAIAEKTGVGDRDALFSTREFKKTRVRYFMGDIEGWEAARG